MREKTNEIKSLLDTCVKARLSLFLKIFSGELLRSLVVQD